MPFLGSGLQGSSRRRDRLHLLRRLPFARIDISEQFVERGPAAHNRESGNWSTQHGARSDEDSRQRSLVQQADLIGLATARDTNRRADSWITLTSIEPARCGDRGETRERADPSTMATSDDRCRRGEHADHRIAADADIRDWVLGRSTEPPVACRVPTEWPSPATQRPRLHRPCMTFHVKRRKPRLITVWLVMAGRKGSPAPRHTVTNTGGQTRPVVGERGALATVDRLCRELPALGGVFHVKPRGS